MCVERKVYDKENCELRGQIIWEMLEEVVKTRKGKLTPFRKNINHVKRTIDFVTSNGERRKVA